MKKYIIISLFAFTAILIIFSCRKSPVVEPTSSSSKSTSVIENKILQFLTSFDSQLKDEEMYSIEEVLWFSTAGLNYSYAIYDSSFVYTDVDTSHFSMDIDIYEQVAEGDLEAVYDDMVDSLEAQNDALQDNIKHLIYCMVYQETVESGILYVGMVSVFGYGYSGNFYGSFGEADYWYAILDYGKCDEYAPVFYGVKDAGDVIAYKINHPLVLHHPDYRIYTIPGSEYYEYDIDPQDFPYGPSPCGFRGYFNNGTGSWPGPECLDPDHLNFYLTSNGINYIIDYYHPGGGLDFLWIEMIGELLFIEEEGYEEKHIINLTYGETYQTVVPAGTL